MKQPYRIHFLTISKASVNRCRVRLFYLAAVAVTMLIGLASRRYEEMLPSWLAVHAGDALWAAMIYWGMRMLIESRRPYVAVIGALLFSYSIECSQIYQAEWINHLRSTMLGGLILGHGFLVADLARYTVGILLAWMIDRLIKAAYRYYKTI